MVHGKQFTGKKKTHTLRYDINSMCAMESMAGRELLGMGLSGTGDRPLMMQLFMAGSASTVRLLVWAGMQHSNPQLSLEAAGHAMQDYVDGGGSLEALAILCNDAMVEAGFETRAGGFGGLHGGSP